MDVVTLAAFTHNIVINIITFSGVKKFANYCGQHSHIFLSTSIFQTPLGDTA